MIATLLEQLKCHHIKKHSNYITCGVPDGDNPSSVIVYTDTPNFYTIAYTRNIGENNKTDIFDLISYIRKEKYFPNNVKWVCDILNISYYNDDSQIPQSLVFTMKYLQDKGNIKSECEIEYKNKPLDENILQSYLQLPNKIFTDDGISCFTQNEFEIGYDDLSCRITIPIRDEIGTLVGIKGRSILPDAENKYIYLEPCNKNKLLYNLYKAYPYIQSKNEIIVVESEKSVMKLWQNGVYNSVAIGSHSISEQQVKTIIRLEIQEVVICYDEDVFRCDKTIDIEEYKKEVGKFISQQKISIMIDVNGSVLSKKESPADDINKFHLLYKNRIILNR